MKPLPSPNKIGLGLLTYNRPDYFRHSLKGVVTQLQDQLSSIWVYNDGSTADYSQIEISPPIQSYTAEQNQGVTFGKNWLLQRLLDDGCDYLFILEDDIVPTAPGAISGYIAAATAAKRHFYAYAHHGDLNSDGPALIEGKTSYYPHLTFGYTMYTRPSLEEVGLIDEHFKNSWGETELMRRLHKAGYASWPYQADATDSRKWLKDVPGSFDNPVLPHDNAWRTDRWEGYEYWQKKDGKHFPPGMVQ